MKKKFEIDDIVIANGLYSFDPIFGIIIKKLFNGTYSLKVDEKKTLDNKDWTYASHHLKIYLSRKQTKDLSRKELNILFKLLSKL